MHFSNVFQIQNAVELVEKPVQTGGQCVCCKIHYSAEQVICVEMSNRGAQCSQLPGTMLCCKF